MADLLISKRSKAERWTTKTRNQADQIFTLLTRFMLEERSITRMSQVRQKDLATFVNFLEAEIYKHHGKSEKEKPLNRRRARIFTDDYEIRLLPGVNRRYPQRPNSVEFGAFRKFAMNSSDAISAQGGNTPSTSSIAVLEICRIPLKGLLSS
jgi:hypothetical protein